MKITEITDTNLTWQSLKNDQLEADIKDIVETFDGYIKIWPLISRSPSLHTVHKSNLDNFLSLLESFSTNLSNYPDQEDQDIQRYKGIIDTIIIDLLKLE